VSFPEVVRDNVGSSDVGRITSSLRIDVILGRNFLKWALRMVHAKNYENA